MPHTFTCQQCGKVFTVEISKKRAEKREYCSRKCANTARRKPLKTCPVCGKKFKPDNKETVHCSQKCYHSTLPPHGRLNVCKNCGKKFTDHSYAKNRKYCSADCYNQTRTKPVEKACLGCGQTFTTIDRRRKYCDRTCYDKDKANPSRYKPCEVCGKPMYLNYPDRRFCSKKCRLKAGWNERDPDKRGTYTCEWCGEEFESWAYRPNRFCSKKCAAQYGGSVGGRPQQPGYRIRKFCDWCGREYITNKSQIRLRNPRFCSTKCYYAARSVEARGENNPNWNGGTVDPDAYGPNWGRQKRRVKQRDNHSCQVCGYQAGGEHFLDVHHIVPIRNFNGDWKKSNRLSNLICLCRPCHRGVEKGKIPCPRPRVVKAMAPC